MEKIEITQQMMNLILMGVGHGYKACQKCEPIERALERVFDLYCVKQPEHTEIGNGAESAPMRALRLSDTE